MFWLRNKKIKFSLRTQVLVHASIKRNLLVPIAQWIRHPLREQEVEGSIPSVGDNGVRSDMAGW